jgi:hypothetical protein
MFNFFRRQPQQDYDILGRLKSGTFFLRHTVRAASPYEACRLFDTSPEYQAFTRVSGATVSTGV